MQAQECRASGTTSYIDPLILSPVVLLGASGIVTDRIVTRFFS
jgi:hypothetical protein